MKPYDNNKKFKTTKSLGQNFLKDKGVIEDIVYGAQIGENDLVIEIGPGMGVLTKEAAKIAARLVAVEIDSRLIPILEDELSGYDNFRVINEDILKTDISEIIRIEKNRCAEEGIEIENVIVIGNLPYYITTPIITKLLEAEDEIKSITIMMQKEVADRINAEPGTKAYGAISVAVQFHCHVSRILDVSKECFRPIPKVDSAVLRLDIRDEKPVELVDRKMFDDCVKRAFSQRRKTMLNCFTGFRGYEKEEMKEQLIAAGFDPGIRGEMLDICEYGRLANYFATNGSICGKR